MEPVDPLSRAPGSARRPKKPLNPGQGATAPHSLIAHDSPDLLAMRSRERTHAVPLKRTIDVERTRRQSRTIRPKRLSSSKRSKPSGPMRAWFARARIAREARARVEEAEIAEGLRTTEVALEMDSGRSDVLKPQIIGVSHRIGSAINTMRIARALGRRKKPAGHAAHRKRLTPPWMWAALNVLAVFLFAQACVMSEVDSSAIKNAVSPLFQAFTGAQPDTFDTGGPIPRPVYTPAAFVTTMLPYARRASQTLGWPVSMILAQWGVEHGWTLPDFDKWNEGNVKAFNSPTGICYGASVVRDFCAPKTPGAGVAIYIHSAQLHYYSGIAVAARQGGPDAAARALGNSPWDAGHYTSDNSPGDSLLHAMRAFDLYRYDTQ